MNRGVWSIGVGVFIVMMALAQERRPEPPKKQTPEERATELVYAGKDLVTRGKTEEALVKYREALKLRPDWIQARMDAGRLAFEVGKTRLFNGLDMERQAKALREKAGKDPAKLAEVEALEERAKKERGKADAFLEEAMGHCQKVVEGSASDDDILNCHLYTGHIHAFYKRWEEAKAAYSKAKAMGLEGEALKKVDGAIELVDREIEKKKRKEGEGRFH